MFIYPIASETSLTGNTYICFRSEGNLVWIHFIEFKTYLMLEKSKNVSFLYHQMLSSAFLFVIFNLDSLSRYRTHLVNQVCKTKLYKPD